MDEGESNDVDSDEPLTYRGVLISLFGLWWAFSALIGAPTIAAVIDALFVRNDPGLLLTAIIEGYYQVRSSLLLVLGPVVEQLVEFVGRFDIDILPRDYWVEMFIMFSIWTTATAQLVAKKTKMLWGFAAFFALTAANLILTVAGASVRMSNTFVEQLVAPIVPFIGISYFWLLFVFASGLVGVRFAGYLGYVLVGAWLPFGVAFLIAPGALIFMYFDSVSDELAGVASLLFMLAVVARGAAVDAMAGGDATSAKLYLSILGPYLGYLALLLGDTITRTFW